MKKFIYLIFLILPLTAFSQEKGATEQIPEGLNIKTEEKASVEKTAGEFKDYKSRRTPEVLSYDQNKPWQIVPADTFFAIRIDPTQDGLFETRTFELEDAAKEAIKMCPKWMQPDLVDNLRRLFPALQRNYSKIIKNADVQKRDEIAFSVAHLAPETLNGMKEELLEVNAEYIYKIEPELKYVKLAEYGSEESGNWHTTTTYKVLKDGDTVWVEIPREMYYWWVVMPKLSDERPLMNFTVNNEFWRQHVWENADEGFPLLKDVLKNTEFMWDCQEHKWRNEEKIDDTTEVKIPFHDSLYAVAVVGRWVAHTVHYNEQRDPEENWRPIQPNQILHHHNGNCGELQDLLNAGARTALLPVSSVSSHPGDHVWNELYWENEWWYYQVSWDCGPTFVNQSREYKEKACITGYRADMYRWMVNEHYNPVCTLNIKTVDKNNKPVDCAEVSFFAASYKDPHAQEYYYGSSLHSDANGELSVLLSADITHAYRGDHPMGHSPSESNRVNGLRYNIVKEGDELDAKIEFPFELPVPLTVTKISPSAGDEYKVELNYEVPYNIAYGGGYWQADLPYDDYTWNDFRENGEINFYLVNEENYWKFEKGMPFEAYEIFESSITQDIEFTLPSSDEQYFIIFSNRSKTIASQFLQYNVELFKNDGADWTLVKSLNKSNVLDVAENVKPGPVEMNLIPNPAQNYVEITFNPERMDDYNLSVYDTDGNFVTELHNGVIAPGQNTIGWNCSNTNGEKVGSGVYFIVLSNEKQQVVKKSIVISK